MRTSRFHLRHFSLAACISISATSLAQTTEPRPSPTIGDLQHRINDLQPEINASRQPAAPVAASSGNSKEVSSAAKSTSSQPNSPATPSAIDAAVATQPVPREIASPQTRVDTQTSYAFADFTWLNGGPRTETPPSASNFFTREIQEVTRA